MTDAATLAGRGLNPRPECSRRELNSPPAGPVPPGLTARQWTTTRNILRAHAPPGARVWMFGSRARGTAGKFSDLDLAVDCGRPMTFAEAGRLDLAFEESPLPWPVDVVDWNAVAPAFQTRIAQTRLPLPV